MSGDDPKSSGVAGRYATALLELAIEDGAIDQVSGDLDRLAGLMDESEDLERLVRSPVFSADDQERALEAVMGQAGFSGLSRNFIKLLARNRRLFTVRDVIRAFKSLVAKHRGEVTASVTSAAPLGAEQLESVRETLRASVGKDVQLETHVDPELLGGLVVKIGSRMIDSSIRTKLNSLRYAMKEVG